MPVTADRAYLRFPSIRGDRIAFIAENDVWLTETTGGRAWRLTADDVPVAGARLSPDGETVAFTSTRDGAPEVHAVPVEGGVSTRLTYWGDPQTRVAGWLPDGRVVASTAVGEPFRSRVWSWALPLDGSAAPERLPYGPCYVVSPGPGGAVVLGTDQRRAGATWKRYRGGTTGKLWIDRDGSGAFDRLLGDNPAQLEYPDWVGDRIAFLSDHEGIGNLYSSAPTAPTCAGTPTTAILRPGRRHRRHPGRLPGAGDLWLLDGLDAQPRTLEVGLGGPRAGRRPHPVGPGDKVGDLAADHTGRASAVEVRGSLHWLTHRDGPARALADTPGVRARLPRCSVRPPAETRCPGGLGHRRRGRRRARDRPGRRQPRRPRRLGGGPARPGAGAGRLPGRQPARRRRARRPGCWSSTWPPGEVREVGRSEHGDGPALAFSPDSAWLAWSQPGRGRRCARSG